MDTKKITGAVEFVSVEGDQGGIDALIKAWVRMHPDASIVDVKFQTAIYKEDGKTKLIKLALVLYHKEQSTMPKAVYKVETQVEPKQEPVKENPGARTMVMNLRKDLYVDDSDG